MKAHFTGSPVFRQIPGRLAGRVSVSCRLADSPPEKAVLTSALGNGRDFRPQNLQPQSEVCDAKFPSTRGLSFPFMDAPIKPLNPRQRCVCRLDGCRGSAPPGNRVFRDCRIATTIRHILGICHPDRGRSLWKFLASGFRSDDSDLDRHLCNAQHVIYSGQRKLCHGGSHADFPRRSFSTFPWACAIGPTDEFCVAFCIAWFHIRCGGVDCP